MTDPLHCPFCGHTGVSVVQTDTHKWRAAQCNECGARSGDARWVWNEEDPDAKAEARALAEWNKRCTRIVLPQDDFDALQQRLAEPGQYDQRVARVLSTPAPWDDDCDKTSTSAKPT